MSLLAIAVVGWRIPEARAKTSLPKAVPWEERARGRGVSNSFQCSPPHPCLIQALLPLVLRRQARTCLLLSLSPAVISIQKGCLSFFHPLRSSEQLSGSKKALVLRASLEKADRQWEAPFPA